MRCGFPRALTRWCLLAALVAVADLLSAEPAAAQSGIVGFWDQPAIDATPAPAEVARFGFVEDSTERASGPALVDYLGIPLNEEGRARALTYNSSLLTVPEHACMRHPSQYSFWGPAAPRISAEYDEELRLIAYTVVGTFRRADRTIYMDGRSHPSAPRAAHVGWIYHRDLEGRHARHHHPSEVGLDPAQRRPCQRPIDRHHLLHPQRRRAHHCLDGARPAVPDGDVH